MLSMSRAVLTIPFMIIMLSGRPDARAWGIAIMIAGILTDRYDGILARRLDQVTEWGKILDPLADKIGMAAVGVTLLIRHELPLWFVVVLFIRDALIFGGGMYLKSRRGLILPSNTAGKWTTGVVSGAMTLALAGVEGPVLVASLVAAAAMLIVSFGIYCVRFIEVMRAHGH